MVAIRASVGISSRFAPKTARSGSRRLPLSILRTASFCVLRQVIGSKGLRTASMFKQRSSFARKRATGRKLWQEGFFDRVLRNDEATLDVIAYIIKNPIRAGYCVEPREYPFTGSTLYTVDQLCEAIQSRPGNRWRP
jgi:hypothetical protein